MNKFESPSFQNQENIAKKNWDKRYQEKESYRKEPALEIVENYFEERDDDPRESKVLAIGCGNGRNLRHVAEQGYDAYGMEISEKAIQQLDEDFENEGLKAEVKKGSFYNLPYEDEKFDYALSINVFQHNDWAGAEKAFAEASRVLKNNGELLLSVRSTSRDIPEEREDIDDKGITFTPSQGSKQGIKIHHFSEEEIRELAQKSSLEVVSIQEVLKEEKSDGGEKKDTIVKKAHWQVVLKKIDTEV